MVLRGSNVSGEAKLAGSHGPHGHSAYQRVAVAAGPGPAEVNRLTLSTMASGVHYALVTNAPEPPPTTGGRAA